MRCSARAGARWSVGALESRDGQSRDPGLITKVSGPADAVQLLDLFVQGHALDQLACPRLRVLRPNRHAATGQHSQQNRKHKPAKQPHEYSSASLSGINKIGPGGWGYLPGSPDRPI